MKRIISTVLLLAFTATVFTPYEVKAAGETLQDYINLVEQYEREYNEAQSKVNLTQDEINQINAEINSINNQITLMKNEVLKMQQEILDANLEIKDKSLESKDLFQYLQLSSGDNIYMEYIFGATDITEMIYRMSIVEQLTEYNDEIIKELEALIEANNQREIELNEKSNELNQKNVELAEKKSELEGQKITASEGAVSAKQELANQQKLVQTFKDAGCGLNDVIYRDCLSSTTAVGWFYPTNTGRLTSYLGPRWGTFHQGTDLTSSYGSGEKIYPVANGTITSIYTDIYGALCVIIYHQDIYGKWYTSLYAHLSSYAPGIYVGKNVTHNDFIGYMGTTGYSTGIHLHLELIDCRLYDPTDRNCYNWSSYSNYIENRYYAGYNAAKELLNLPSVWYSR